MIDNYFSFSGFIISVICLGVYVLFLTPKQFKEVLRPVDWLTGLRWYILLILILAIITSIPSTLYQLYRALGDNYIVLQNISTVTSQISKLSTTILLVLVFTYSKKD